MSNTNLLRRRLIDSISEGDNQITYIYGPAGFGKSILATQWGALQKKPTIWFNAFKANRAVDLFSAFVESITESIPSLNPKLSHWIPLNQYLNSCEIYLKLLKILGFR